MAKVFIHRTNYEFAWFKHNCIIGRVWNCAARSDRELVVHLCDHADVGLRHRDEGEVERRPRLVENPSANMRTMESNCSRSRLR